MASNKGPDLTGFPTAAPPPPTKPLRYFDIAVTATAKEFAGIYRGTKQYHPPDFPATLPRALAAGVSKIMLTGMSLSDIPTNTALAAAHPSQCHLTIGIHPYHAAEPAGDATYLARLGDAVDAALALQPSPLAAFGELGLDYDRLTHADRETQLATLRAQMDLFVARRWSLPLFLHCRGGADAVHDLIAVLTPYLPRLPRRGVVHSFTGSTAEMEALVAALDVDISVNGFSFATREGCEMVRAVPLGRLQIETDAPWGEVKAGAEVVRRYCGNAPELPAARKREKWEKGCMVKERNESCAISRVAWVVAGLKGMGVEDVAEAAWGNSVRMFGLGEGE